MFDVVAQYIHRQIAHALAARLGEVGKRIGQVFWEVQGYPGHGSLDEGVCRKAYTVKCMTELAGRRKIAVC